MHGRVGGSDGRGHGHGHGAALYTRVGTALGGLGVLDARVDHRIRQERDELIRLTLVLAAGNVKKRLHDLARLLRTRGNAPLPARCPMEGGAGRARPAPASRCDARRSTLHLHAQRPELCRAQSAAQIRVVSRQKACWPACARADRVDSTARLARSSELRKEPTRVPDQHTHAFARRHGCTAFAVPRPCARACAHVLAAWRSPGCLRAAKLAYHSLQRRRVRCAGARPLIV